MKFTKIPENTFKELQLNAGILLDSFIPATGVIGNIMGATSGGISFTATPSFKDFGEDIDNCPKNTMELKQIEFWEAKMSGTFASVTASLAKTLTSASDIDSQDGTHIIPRNDLMTSDFSDVWLVGDYSNVNTGESAGFLAIHLMNSLSTGGFQIQTADKDKGKFSFEFTGHYSMDAQDIVPFEIYIRQGIGLTVPTAEAESPNTTLFDTLVSDMQTNVAVTSGKITGTLKFIEGGLASSGPLAGDGNFLALKFTAGDWSKYTSVKVGLEPSQETGLVELINDPDKNGVFKVTSNSQKFKIVAKSSTEEKTTTYSLTGLVLENS